MSLFSTLESLWSALATGGGIGAVAIFLKAVKQLKKYFDFIKTQKEEERMKLQKRMFKQLLKEEGLINNSSKDEEETEGEDLNLKEFLP